MGTWGNSIRRPLCPLRPPALAREPAEARFCECLGQTCLPGRHDRGAVRTLRGLSWVVAKPSPPPLTNLKGRLRNN